MGAGASALPQDLPLSDETRASLDTLPKEAKDELLQAWSKQQSATAVTPEVEAQRLVAICMSLNRCMVPAYHRVKAYNFDIQGLVGFDMQLRTVGVVGNNAAAACCAKLFEAFGATVATAGPADDLSSLLSSDIIALHLPAGAALTASQLDGIKEGAVLLAATSSMVDLPSAQTALSAGKLGKLGIGALDGVATDAVAALTANPNVLIAGRAPSGYASDTAAAADKCEPTVAGSTAEDACRVAFFSARSYFTERFGAAVASVEGVRFESHSARLDASTVSKAAGCKAVCLFVNDDASAEVLRTLKAGGTECIFMRCAGFDKVDLAVAQELGMRVLRVPAYSPEAVAQQAVALLLALKWNLATNAAGAAGLDLKNTTVGVLGTGRIGYLFAMIMQGFGCKVLAYDPYKNKAIEEAGIPYLTPEEIYAQADVISIHVPLLPATKYMINEEVVPKLKKGCTLLNVSRGALVATQAIIDGLTSGQISAYGTDVYEYEANYFFDDHSGKPMEDKLLKDLIAAPNMQITGHQAFLTNEALGQIVGTTMTNLQTFRDGAESKNEVKPPPA